MKIIIIALLLTISVTAFGQNKNTPKTTNINHADVVNIGGGTKEGVELKKSQPIQANDSTALFSARDLQPLLERLAKMPYESAAPLIGYLQQLLALRMKEWEELQNKPKNK